MKARTAQLLTLISNKKKEIREAKRNKAIHEHTMKRRESLRPLTKEEKREFQQMVREGLRLMEIDRRADAQLNKDVNNIHKYLFGY